MSPRRNAGTGSGKGTPQRIDNRDDCIRHFWAAFMRSHVLPDGTIEGWSSFESRMHPEARRMVWRAAEDCWASVHRNGWAEATISTHVDSIRSEIDQLPRTE